MVQHGDKWWAFMSAVTNLRVPQKVEKFCLYDDVGLLACEISASVAV